MTHSATLVIRPAMATRLGEALLQLGSRPGARVALPGHFILSRREDYQVSLEILNLSPPEPVHAVP